MSRSPIALSSTELVVTVKLKVCSSTQPLVPSRGYSDSDKSSREDRIRSLGGNSTTATTPDDIKSPLAESPDESPAERRPRKPVGGVAVFGQMVMPEMKRIAEGRRSPAAVADSRRSKSPSDRRSPGLSLGDHDSLERKYGKRESRLNDEVCISSSGSLSFVSLPWHGLFYFLC